MTKSNIRTITYSRTFNNGNYENSKMEITADVFQDDDPEEAMGLLMDIMEDWRDEELQRMNKAKR